MRTRRRETRRAGRRGFVRGRAGLYTSRRMAIETSHYQPGKRVRVVQQIARSREPWTSIVEGVIVGYEQSKTGSWFAHAKDDRLWLDRLTLRKDDGEIVVCNLDQYSRVETVESAGAAG